MKLSPFLRGAALFAALISVWTSACSGKSGNSTSGGGSSGSSGGTTGGTTGDQEVDITVTGTAKVHPTLAELYGDGGLLTGAPPAVAGLELRVDEPLRVILGLDHARLGTQTLGADGAYSISQINVDNVTVGLVATIANPSPDGGLGACDDPTPPSFCSSYETSATGIADGKPSADITGTEAYGVPVAFEQLLNTKLSLSEATALDNQGWVLGLVLDAQGKPVQGVSVDPGLNSTLPPNGFTYLDDDFNPIAAADTAHQVTNKYGLFLCIAPGDPSKYTHTFGIRGHTEVGCHKLGSNPGSVFNLVFDARKPGACR